MKGMYSFALYLQGAEDGSNSHILSLETCK